MGHPPSAFGISPRKGGRGNQNGALASSSNANMNAL